MAFNQSDGFKITDTIGIVGFVIGIPGYYIFIRDAFGLQKKKEVKYTGKCSQCKTLVEIQ